LLLRNKIYSERNLTIYADIKYVETKQFVKKRNTNKSNAELFCEVYAKGIANLDFSAILFE